jgi:hypothetical protein
VCESFITPQIFGILDSTEHSVLTEIRHLRQDGNKVRGIAAVLNRKIAAQSPWLGVAAGARSANHRTSNRPALILKSLGPGPASGGQW